MWQPDPNVHSRTRWYALGFNATHTLPQTTRLRSHDDGAAGRPVAHVRRLTTPSSVDPVLPATDAYKRLFHT